MSMLLHGNGTQPLLHLLCLQLLLWSAFPLSWHCLTPRHLLHYDLNDTEDVNSKLRDVPINYLLPSQELVPLFDPHLFQSYWLSLYVSDLWTVSCPALQNIDLQNIEVAFNKIMYTLQDQKIYYCCVLLCMHVQRHFKHVHELSMSQQF